MKNIKINVLNRNDIENQDKYIITWMKKLNVHNN